MSLSSVQSTGSVLTGNTAREDISSDKLRDNFLTMLIAQLRNQDPTNPMDNNQITAQLTQFQMVSGIEAMTKNISIATDTVKDIQKSNLAQWIAKKALIEGVPRVTVGKDDVPNIEKQTLNFSLSHSVPEVDVVLTDRQGRSFIGKLKSGKAGLNRFRLDEIKNITPRDPLQMEHNPWLLDNTDYRVSYTSQTASGHRPDIRSLKPAIIQGVAFAADGPRFQLGENGSVKISDIYLIE